MLVIVKKNMKINLSILLILICPIVTAEGLCPLGPSIKLKEPEHGYGPPSVPVENVNQEIYQNAKLNSKSNFQSLYYIGYMAYELAIYEEAIIFFKKAKKIAKNKIPHIPFSAHFYAYFALAYDGLKNYKNAKYYFLKHGDPYYIHMINAKLLRENEEYKKAEQEYLLAQSVKLYEMNNFEPFRIIAEMYVDSQDYRLARKYIIKYIQCAKCDLNAHGVYSPIDDKHIKSAIEFLETIEKQIKY